MTEKTKRVLLITTIIASLIPPVLLVAWPSMATADALSLWAADVLGYIGIVLLLWMYILGAKSVMGIIFEDIAPVLSIHKWLGKYGVLAVFIHPLLITLSFGESLLYSFVPHIGTLYERHVTLGRISFWILLLTWFVSALLRDRIAFRPWKYLHYLAYICVPFALLHIPNVGSHYMTSQAIQVYFFLLLMAFVVVTVVRLRGILNLDTSIYTVTSHAKLNGTDYELTLKPKFRNHISPRRGQFVYLKLGYVSEDHPFSVLRYDQATNNLTIGYRVFGDYTAIVSKLSPGSTVYVGGPYGSFMSDYDHDPLPAVFISGGIGITPFVDQIIQHHATKEQWLFAANRERATAVFTDELMPYLGDKLVRIYSRQTGAMFAGEVSGHITGELLKEWLGDLSRYSFYLCGPSTMMIAMRKLLLENDVTAKRIHSEKFGW